MQEPKAKCGLHLAVVFGLNEHLSLRGLCLLDTSLMESNHCGAPSCTITSHRHLHKIYEGHFGPAGQIVPQVCNKKKNYDSVLIPIQENQNSPYPEGYNNTHLNAAPLSVTRLEGGHSYLRLGAKTFFFGGGGGEHWHQVGIGEHFWTIVMSCKV